MDRVETAGDNVRYLQLCVVVGRATFSTRCHAVLVVCADVSSYDRTSCSCGWCDVVDLVLKCSSFDVI